MNKEQIAALIEKEIVGIQDEAVIAWLADHLIDPRSIELLWEYGNNEAHTAWIVADTLQRNVVVAFCQGGHGAYGDPWGLIFSDGKHFGMDCAWFPSLQAAIYEGSSVPAPSGWEVP